MLGNANKQVNFCKKMSKDKNNLQKNKTFSKSSDNKRSKK